jgi:hypothetical protein
MFFQNIELCRAAIVKFCRAVAGTPSSVFGLFWGAAMLVVFALWIAKFEPPSLPPPTEPGLTAPRVINPPPPAVIGILWALAGAGALLGVWNLLSLRKFARTPDAAAELRTSRRLGLFLIFGGLVLAVLGLYLVFTLRLAGFAESVGLCLFALIPLISGYNLQHGPGSGDIVSFMLPRADTLAILLFIAGGVGLIAFIYLAAPWVKNKLGAESLPELASLVFESLLCITAGFWLITSQPADRTPLAMRCVLMVLGGGTGFILALESFFRTYMWRQNVLFGGMAAWLGSNSWEFWLCAYIGLFGLALIFGSMLLARSEVRTQPTLRQALYGFSAVASGLLLLGFLAILNVLSNAMFPMTYEWSERGLVSLSPASQTILGMLEKKPAVTVYVMIPQSSGSPSLYNEMKHLLDNCVAAAPADKLIVKYVSPTGDEDIYYDLLSRFPEIGTENSIESQFQRMTTGKTKGRGVLLVQGKLPEDRKALVPHSFIPDRKLLVSAQGPTGEEKRSFMGEAEFMRDLNFLLRDQKQHKVYILQGDEELNINSSQPRDPAGGGVLADRLKTDNYEVLGLNFGTPPLMKPKERPEKYEVVFPQESGAEKRKDVPKDAWALMVLDPKTKMPKETLDALERFMDRGGRMLVTLGVGLTPDRSQIRKSGVEELLRKYGVSADEGFVARATEGNPFTIIGSTPPNSTTELAKQFRGEGFEFALVRVIRPQTAGKYKGEVLLEADNRFGPDDRPYLVENNVKALLDPRYFALNRLALKRQIAMEPIPIAVTVSEDEVAQVGQEGKARPRLVVFGNTIDFVNNTSLFFEGRTSFALLVGSLEWMGERQVLPIGPKETKNFALPPTAQLGRMMMVPLFIMTFCIVGLAAGVWLVRRR